MNRYLFLLAITAAISFAGSVRAFDMNNIGDGSFNFVLFTGANAPELNTVLGSLDDWTPYADAYIGFGNPGGGMYVTHGGGFGSELTLEVLNVINADVCEFEIWWGTTSLGTDIADISGGVSNHFFHTSGGLQIEVVFGTNGGDSITLVPDTHYSIIFGMEGNDTIEANHIGSGGTGSRDVIFGGPGDDVIVAHENHDVIFGNWFDEANWLGQNEIECGDGNDWAYTGDSDGNNNAGAIYGGEGGDVLIGGFGSQYLHGEGATDWMEGGGNGDYMWGGAGCDNMYGDVGPILRWAMTQGFGTWSDSNQYGGEDEMHGEAGDDYMRGMEGNDELYGGTGKDCIDGGTGADIIYGDSGDDFLHDVDGVGGNYLYGGSENDLIVCWDGNGIDYFDGGSENDTFYYDFNVDSEIGTPQGTNTHHTTIGTLVAAGYTGGDPFDTYARNEHWGAGMANRAC